ncbi:MAG: SGNH/GDSL hydrolase family protein [Planctomycetota bacterium]
MLLAGSASATFDELIVFGDSLTDVGNVEATTDAIPLVPATPGPAYFNGRFSNGPVWVENLSASLSLGPVVRSGAGGDNFAHGGALASGSSFPFNLVVDDLDDQVDDFLNRDGTADAADLFVILIGGNDIEAAVNGGSNATATAAATETLDQITRLYDAGARHFLTPNLPDLGLVPRYDGQEALATSRTLAFNTTLDAGLDAFELARPDATLFRLDLVTLFADLVADPASFGLVNVTDSAAPGLVAGDGNYDLSQVVSNADEFLFWDDLHPTATGHALLADAAFAVIPEPTLGLTLLVPAILLRRYR